MNYGKTKIVVCENEKDLGFKAAAAVASTMRNLLRDRDEIRVIFAAGESQIAFLNAIATQPDIDWARVVCFNMDDFHEPGLPETYTCGYVCRKELYEKVNPKQINLVRFDAPDPEAEAKRFEQAMRAAGPMDILCQGIGRSGHLAFNEPGGTDFNDPKWVRVIEIVEASKKQLMDDPSFKELGYIPARGITMTIPALLSASHVFTMVPLATKRDILTKVLAIKEPTTEYPATILSQYDGTLFLDKDSCPEFLKP